jgi:predicted amino acid racemase
VYLRDELREKISKSGYEAVTVKEIDDISRLRAAKTTYALKGICLLQGEAISDELL